MSRWRGWPRLLIGALLIVVGAVWLGQGLGLIPGSFMTSDPAWAVAGGVAIVAGGLIVLLTILRR
jgi:hypothetical protein